MKLTELSLSRPSFTTVVFIALFVLGLFSYFHLPADLLPKMQFPYVAVMVPYPGAGPEEVEQKVTKPLEDAFSSLNNLDHLNSFSQEGMAVIWIGFKLDTDPDVATNEVQRKYNAAVHQLPPDIEPATIQQFNLNDTPVLQLSVTGNLPEATLYNLVKNEIQPRLQQTEGVSRILLLGGREQEIRVEVQPEQLEAYKISLLQVLATLQEDNQDVPAGRVEQAGENFVVRVKSQVTVPRELEQIIVANTKAGPIYLRDVAHIRDTFKDPASIARVGGRPGIALAVFKRTDANTIETSAKVREAVAALEKSFGVKITCGYDAAEFIKDSLAGIQEELGLAVLVVAVVIFFFLGSLRGALIVLLTIPTSLVGTLVFVRLCGFSLNLMTLLGAALVVGIVVDDAIVILENIYRHLEKGEEPVAAALASSREIGLAVTGISLTLAVVFLPVALVSGIAGKIFREFGLVVVCATLLSLVVALTLIPLLVARLARPQVQSDTSLQGHLDGTGKGFLAQLSRAYEKGIAWALAHKEAVLATATFSFLAAGALLPLHLVGTEFIPKVDRGEFVLKLSAPPGTTLEKMDALVQGIEQEIRALPEVKNIFTTIGYTTGQWDAGASSNVAELKVLLKVRGAEKTAPVKEKVKALAERRAGLESSLVLTSLFGGAEDAALQIELRGYNLQHLQETAELVRKIVAATPGMQDVRTSVESGLPEYNIRVDREAAAAHGVTTSDVIQTVGLYLAGKVAGKYSDGKDQYDMRLIADPAARDDTNDLPELLLLNRVGEPIRLGQVAKFSQETGLKRISHVDRQRVFVVNANLAEGYTLGDAVRAIKEKLAGASIPPDVTVFFGGEQKMFEESMRDLLTAMVLSLIFVYLIMVALFESFLLPLTIWLAVPLALVGALFALALTRDTINIISMVGLIMLVGLVTKNAILLVDFANQARKRGLSINEALAQAGALRLRPILMTTAAMVTAMIPLALGISSGSEMRQGMSVALIGGLIFSTLLTLFIVPVVYSLLEGLKEKALGLRWRR
ncbi:efflux RND transporter permease subunit [Thermodesulfitimonas autotrophica]|uniref:efflux RND transporter permease subunit n=1 Tax=Thermodesulfitimonas autotrophica TaxID=1894989 RepID=UPI002FE29750